MNEWGKLRLVLPVNIPEGFRVRGEAQKWITVWQSHMSWTDAEKLAKQWREQGSPGVLEWVAEPRMM